MRDMPYYRRPGHIFKMGKESINVTKNDSEPLFSFQLENLDVFRSRLLLTLLSKFYRNNV